MPVIQERVSVSVETILLATDFSSVSEQAAAYARALAQRFSSTVEIAHIVNPLKESSSDEAILTPSREERKQNSKDRLESLQHDFTDLGIKAHTISPVGHRVAAALLTIAREKHVNLLVTGTQSRKGFERLLLGSTAEEIIRNAPCPVLTVGPKAEAPASGALVFKSIVFATDFSAEAAKAAVFALSFAEDSGAHLYFCHVLALYPGWERESPIVDAIFTDALKKMVPQSSYDWCSPECILQHGEAASGILAVADRVHADLIVLGVRSESFLLRHLDHGLTPDLLAEAVCPVLTIC